MHGLLCQNSENNKKRKEQLCLDSRWSRERRVGLRAYPGRKDNHIASVNLKAQKKISEAQQAFIRRPLAEVDDDADQVAAIVMLSNRSWVDNPRRKRT